MAKISDKTKETTLNLTGKFSKNFLSRLKNKSFGSKDSDVTFTGKVKEQKTSGKTAEKIKPLKQGNELIDMLMKIYNFMDKSHNEDKLKNEQSNNFKEEQKIEDNKRHAKLIKAIEDLKKGLGVPTTDTATKEDTDSGGGNDFLSTITGIANAGSLFVKLAPLAEIALPLAAIVAAGFAGKALSDFFNKRGEENEQKDLDQVRNNPFNSKDIEGLSDAGNLNDVKDTFNFGNVRDKRRQQALIEKRIEDGQQFTPEEASLIKRKFDIDVPVKNGGKNTELSPQEKKVMENMIKNNPEGTFAQKYYEEHPDDELTKKYRKSATPAATPNETKPAPAPAAAATPATSTPPSAKLNAVQAENNTAKIDDMTKSPSVSVNNSNVATTPDRPAPRQRTKIPPVRNLEESFQKMIIYSTRVV